MPIYSYEIGTLAGGAGGTTNVESLTNPVKAPRSTWFDYSDVVDLGDSTVRGLGYPGATWKWGYLTQTEYDQLRTFCTGKSEAVYIQTREDDGSYSKWKAVMVWPDQRTIEKRERDGEFYYLDLAIEFRHLETP